MPARFGIPCVSIEATFSAKDDELDAPFPAGLPHLIASHTRPNPLIGLLRGLDSGPMRTKARGYISRGGTLDVAGRPFANYCLWVHPVEGAASLVGWSRDDLLTPVERNTIDGRGGSAAFVGPI